MDGNIWDIIKEFSLCHKDESHKNENGTEVPTKIITVIDETQTEDNKKYPPRYESSITFISINNNEYLISADDNKIVIVWDVLNNFEIKQLKEENSRVRKNNDSPEINFYKNYDANYQ